jgi:hypothetical protein
MVRKPDARAAHHGSMKTAPRDLLGFSQPRVPIPQRGFHPDFLLFGMQIYQERLCTTCDIQIILPSLCRYEFLVR